MSERQKTLCWVTWEENIMWTKFDQFISYYKERNFIKDSAKTVVTLVAGSFVFGKN